ncbi:MAG: 7-carboxy-7-deazaguanine synthase QueE [Crocinitomicaceae bacterium]
MKELEIDTRKELPVMEQFYTIQGEGKYSGKAAYFIRLAGCDVGCVWCDVKESWDRGEHQTHSIASLLANVRETNADFCVITGGEPAMYPLNSLIDSLKERGISTAIETSGCYPLIGDIDWYCFSPKKFKAPTEEAYTKANELKVVIAHPSDFEWAEGHADKVSDSCELYLQPEWSKQERFLPLIIDYIKQHPKWRVSLQTHKFMNIP